MENREVVSLLNDLIAEVKISNQEVFTAKEAAHFLRIGYETLLQQARIGNITYIENGKSFIFTRDSLMDWLKLKEVKR